MNVRVYKNTYDYYVVFNGKDTWEMNEQADKPNGVCMYAGHWSEINHDDCKELDTVPVAILNQCMKMAFAGIILL